MFLPIDLWRTTLTKLGLRPRKTRKGPRLEERRLRLETLEGRQLLTAVSIAWGQDAQEGVQSGYVVFSRDDASQSLSVPYSIDSSSTAAFMSDYSSPFPRAA